MVELLVAAALGITAALVIAPASESKVAVIRQNVASFLPRTRQRSLLTRVVCKGCTIVLDRSLKSYSFTTKFEMRLVDRLLFVFAILLNLYYSPRIQRV